MNFSPAVIPVGSDRSTVSIAAGTTVAAGTYPISILASRAAGVTDTITLSLTVAAAPVTGTAVTLRYCAEDAPIWLAVRENDAWTRVTPNPGTNTYQFRLAFAGFTAVVASVDTVGSGYHLRVIYARPTEMGGISDALGIGECAAGTATGTVLNAGTPVSATVALSHSLAVLDDRSTGQFTLRDVTAAPHDLLATRLDPLTSVPNRMILRRGLTVGAGGTIPALDFGAAEAFVPSQGSVTVSGLGSDSAVVTTAFRGVGGRANGQIGRPASYPGSISTVPFSAIPLAQLQGNEFQQLSITATPANSTTTSRSASIFFRDAGAFSLALGPTTQAPLATRQVGAYARARVQFGVDNTYGRFATATFAQPSANRLTSILVTQNFMVRPGDLPWDLAIPDLLGAVGWNAEWGLRNGEPIAWSVTAAGGLNFRTGTTVSDGAVLRTVTHSGVLPVP